MQYARFICTSLLALILGACDQDDNPALVEVDAASVELGADSGELDSGIGPFMDRAALPVEDASGVDFNVTEPDIDSSTDMALADMAPADMAPADMAPADMTPADMELADIGEQTSGCEDTCARITDCLIESCDGFGGNLRRIIANRCRRLCTPALVDRVAALTCEETVEVVSDDIPQVEAACQQSDPGEGTNALYIGHSFGRGFAARLPEWTANAGIEDHVQRIIFRGGASGAPQALLNHRETRAEIEGVLDEGNTNLLIMICCSDSFLSEGVDPAIRQWMDYALAQNPQTRFALALPWPDFPANYASAAEFSAFWNAGRLLWQRLIDSLRADYPGVDIFCIPHGRAATELRRLFEADELSDVDAMTSGNGAGIFTDRKGHADEILLDLGTLIWLGAIYGIDVTNYPLAREYEADLRGIADLILREDEQLMR